MKGQVEASSAAKSGPSSQVDLAIPYCDPHHRTVSLLL